MELPSNWVRWSQPSWSQYHFVVAPNRTHCGREIAKSRRALLIDYDTPPGVGGVCYRCGVKYWIQPIVRLEKVTHALATVDGWREIEEDPSPRPVITWLGFYQAKDRHKVILRNPTGMALCRAYLAGEPIGPVIGDWVDENAHRLGLPAWLVGHAGRVFRERPKALRGAPHPDELTIRAHVEDEE